MGMVVTECRTHYMAQTSCRILAWGGAEKNWPFGS